MKFNQPHLDRHFYNSEKAQIFAPIHKQQTKITNHLN